MLGLGWLTSFEAGTPLHSSEHVLIVLLSVVIKVALAVVFAVVVRRRRLVLLLFLPLTGDEPDCACADLNILGPEDGVAGVVLQVEQLEPLEKRVSRRGWVGRRAEWALGVGARVLIRQRKEKPLSAIAMVLHETAPGERDGGQVEDLVDLEPRSRPARLPEAGCDRARRKEERPRRQRRKPWARWPPRGPAWLGAEVVRSCSPRGQGGPRSRR